MGISSTEAKKACRGVEEKGSDEIQLELEGHVQTWRDCGSGRVPHSYPDLKLPRLRVAQNSKSRHLNGLASMTLHHAPYFTF